MYHEQMHIKYLRLSYLQQQNKFQLSIFTKFTDSVILNTKYNSVMKDLFTYKSLVLDYIFKH